MKWRAEPISLDGKPQIRLKNGPYHEGYFRTIDELARYLEARGVTLADVEVVGQTG